MSSLGCMRKYFPSYRMKNFYIHILILDACMRMATKYRELFLYSNFYHQKQTIRDEIVSALCSSSSVSSVFTVKRFCQPLRYQSIRFNSKSINPFMVHKNDAANNKSKSYLFLISHYCSWCGLIAKDLKRAAPVCKMWKVRRKWKWNEGSEITTWNNNIVLLTWGGC